MSCEEELGLFSLRKTQEIEIISWGKYEASDTVYGHEGRRCGIENTSWNSKDALILKSGKPGTGVQAIL